MTVALAIAVALLAAGLIYALVSRPREEQPDLAPTIQEATAKAVADAIPGFLRANDEARKVDARTAEATLQKRETEIKALAERIAKGQEKIEQEVRKRGETDLQTRALIEQVGQTVGNLNTETAGLKKALRQPQTRGQWGELQLRRCIEIAGMTEHVDFELQETLQTEEGRLRPDARFLLPEGRSFVADSKVPLDAFLDAQEAEAEAERLSQLERHARQAREHVRSLSSKAYQAQFGAGEMPDLVVCFIPNEPALHAAFGADPTLFDYALERNVLVVGPTSLVGLLRTMELGWRQERMVAEAAAIAEAAATLHAASPSSSGTSRRSASGSTRRPRPTTPRSPRWRAACSPSCARSRASASRPARRSRCPSRSRSPCGRSPRPSCEEAESPALD